MIAFPRRSFIEMTSWAWNQKNMHAAEVRRTYRAEMDPCMDPTALIRDNIIPNFGKHGASSH
jgi:hypothetical protein